MNKRSLVPYVAPLTGDYDSHDMGIHDAPIRQTFKDLLAPQTIPLFTIHYDVRKIEPK